MTRPPSGFQVELAYADQRATVVEVGGGIRSYSVGGRDVVDGYGIEEMCSGARGQPLIPWPNRLRDGRYRFGGIDHQLPLSEPSNRNAIHGLLCWSNWSLAESEAHRATLAYQLHPQAGYPFALDISVAYELGPSGLAVTVRAVNVGVSAAPFGAGAHPYFCLGTPTIDDLLLRAPGRRRLLTDDRLLPAGDEEVASGPYDFLAPRKLSGAVLDLTYFDLERDPDGLARVVLEEPRSGSCLTVWQDAAFGYLTLFTGENLPEVERHRQGLAVEPLTCPPNAFQSGEGLVVLEPAETFEGHWGVSADLR